MRSIEASSEGRVARGLESPVLNDILDTASWSVVQVFPWHGRARINVLELAVIGVLERRLALEAPDSRFITLADSCVAKAAAAKGRSTSVALTPGLRRACSLQIAYGLYPGYGFAPTRLNIADDPTRLVDLRRAAGFPLHRHLSVPALRNLGRLRLRRSLAAWVRLCLAILLSRESCTADFEAHLSGRFFTSSGRRGPLLDFELHAWLPWRRARLDFLSWPSLCPLLCWPFFFLGLRAACWAFLAPRWLPPG